MRKETQKKRGRTYYLRYFDDWLDFVSCAERVENGRRGTDFGGMSCASLTSGDKDWYGTRSLAEAIRLAREGWPAGRKQIRDIRKRLQIDHLLPHAQRIVRQTDVAGDEPDIDLFLYGEPENMVTLYEKNTFEHGKVLRFVFSRDGLADVEAGDMMRRGVAVLAAIETLIVLGYTIEVTIVFSSEEGDYQHEQYIPVLHAGDPINLDTLAVMLAHPAILRRLQFASCECEPRVIRENMDFHDDGGYACSCKPSVLPPHDLFYNWDEGLLDSERKILPFTMKILKRVGVNVSESV